MDKVIIRNQDIYINDINFEKLMTIYDIALEKAKSMILKLHSDLDSKTSYNPITNILSRIKNPESIVNKMIEKGYELTYQSLIENINDVAGLRVVCVSEKDVYKIVKMITKLDNIHILKKKDYIKKPKESGYSAYHIITEIPIYLENNKIWVKVEIQVRTMAMDSWANLEHGVKYKSNLKVCKKDNNL